MKPCIRSAPAPGYAVVTVMTDSSTSGYSRMVMLRKPWMPRSRIRIDVTIVRTGRRMKISEKFMRRSVLPERQGCRIGLVVDDHRHVVGELVLAGGDDRLSGLHTLGDLDHVALTPAELDEDLARHELRLGARLPCGCAGVRRRSAGASRGGGSLGGLIRRRLRVGLLHHVDVVAVEAGHDAGLRQRDHVGDLRQRDAHADELTGPQLAVGILDFGADRNHPRLRDRPSDRCR